MLYGSVPVLFEIKSVVLDIFARLLPFLLCVLRHMSITIMIFFLDQRGFSNLYMLGIAAADVFLWRDKKVSSGVLGVATATWILFELLHYHLLTLVCHSLILSLAILFLWSNATIFINK